MIADDLSIGLRVRYPRTGTMGNVQRIESIGGVVFAELDSTGLLYRVDQLIQAPLLEKTARSETFEDARKVIAQEREFAAGSGLQEALKNIDQSCEGGG